MFLLTFENFIVQCIVLLIYLYFFTCIMALQKAQNSREGIRVVFTELCVKIQSYLEKENVSQAKLLGYKKSLSKIVDQLSIADDDVSKKLNAEDIQADVVESMRLIQPADEIEAAIDIKLSEISLIKNPPVFSVSPSTVSNACRLPKIDLIAFEGDPLKWQGFWDQFQVSFHENERISDIDRFNFLKKYLKGEALGVVSGLNLSAENYKEAIALLKDRYGNEQVLISAHMQSLLSIKKIKNKDNIKSLCNLYNHVESCIRNLRSLKLESKEYGSPLIPILSERRPDDLSIIISRKFGSSIWTLDKVLEYFHEELRAQENCFYNQSLSWNQGLDGKTKPPAFTTSILYTGSGKVCCVYCNKEGHSPSKCRSITNVTSRKDILLKDRRCFLCLQDGHSARECSSKYVCNKCKKGKHHISICNGKTPETMTAFSSENRSQITSFSSSIFLMQTAKAHIFDVNSDNFCLSRILFDTGSQRRYVSINVQEEVVFESSQTGKISY